MIVNHLPGGRTSRERMALVVVVIVVLGIPAATLGYQLLLRPLLAPSPVHVIELSARLPTSGHGGWSQDTVVVQKGERVRLRLTSEDVVHGFSIPKLGIDTGWVEPGKVKQVEFVAGEPGRYAFLCTVWCEDSHWRMRGILQVVDPEDPAKSELDVSPPSTDWVATGVDIDADHEGQFYPSSLPSAAHGEGLWSELTDRPVTDLSPALDLRIVSPSDVFVHLSEAAPLPGVNTIHLSESDRWDLVAYLWSTQTTSELMTMAEKLYQRDCTGCHGALGRGDGPGAEARLHLEGSSDPMHKTATDFTDRVAQAGAPDMLYYGKLVRGGMGTTMPYWGTIYSEQELWALISYVRSFAGLSKDITE